MSKSSATDLLRREKRQQRRALSYAEQAGHAGSLAEHIIRHPRFRAGRRIACYLSNDGEIDPIYIIEQAWSMGKQVYLPVLSPTRNSLLFAPFEPKSMMCINRFGIPEPACHPNEWLRARQIGLILLPLVSFDETGNRVGMGGGFYDRSLAYRRHCKHSKTPYLIGLAHELQKTEELAANYWDIPLDAIATENRIYLPK